MNTIFFVTFVVKVNLSRARDAILNFLFFVHAKYIYNIHIRIARRIAADQHTKRIY